MNTPLHKQLTGFIKYHHKVHFRDVEFYCKNNHYKVYTGTRRLQEVRDPEHHNFDPEIGTIEEDGTIKYYVYFPGRTREEAIVARNANQPQARREIKPKVEQRAVQPESPPINDSVPSQPAFYEQKQRQDWRQSSDFHRPVHKCCQIAILCYEKRLPIQHSAKCNERN